MYKEKWVISDSKQVLRLQTNSIEFHAKGFLPESNEIGGDALSRLKKMEIFLGYVGDPGFLSTIAEDLGIHSTVLSKTSNQVLDSIVDKPPNSIKFPRMVQEVNASKLLWKTSFNLPTLMGALDWTRI